MHIHSSGRRFVVYDDVLDEDQKKVADDLFVTTAMAPTLSPINRFHDGLAFKGPGPLSHLDADALDEPQNDLIAQMAATTIKTLYPHVDDVVRWRYSCTYMLYTAGTQLSWHEDSDGHDAVFNYYLDPWEGDWGGELDVIDCPADEIVSPGQDVNETVVHAPHNVSSVFPRANRMTVMHARTLHRVRRVDQLAGSHVRRAISGSVQVVERASASRAAERAPQELAGAVG